MVSRRNVIKVGVAGGVASLVPTGVALISKENAAAKVEPFQTPLTLPQVARPRLQTATTDYYEMTLRQAEAEILPGFKTTVMGYDGRFPGPTIRARTGRQVVIRHTNGLDHEAAVHLHGGHVAPKDDGQPMDGIAPGESRIYTYPNRQLASTLWYHDHAHHMEAEMVFKGLSGTYLLEDPAERSLRLPSGRYDVPIMLRDARFDDKGQFLYEMDDFRYRNTQLVNGKVQPYFEVAARKYRLRFINGSNERYYLLKLDNDGEMIQIASDGGLLPEPVPASSVNLSPGERVDVVIDFSLYPLGTKIILKNADGDSELLRDVMRFDVVRDAPDESRVPARLRKMRGLGRAEVARERTVTMSLDMQARAFVIDGKVFDPNRIDMQVKRGDVEVWTVHNKDTQPSIPHNMHLHGLHFEVLSRNGRPVGGHEAGWKDTVAVPIGGSVQIRLRYDQYLGKYLYHCHLIDHSSMGMMAQLEVVR
ncbi:multicopper oxidase family protein [Spirillospora sp. CA-294931]|uniref:multicopper oxidase family protein n=1 Tax=Spirillospora sp. CA-294931 TaxID=3240042 RepID=UPI003D9118E5